MILLYDPATGKVNQTMDFAADDRIAQLREQGIGVIELGNDPLSNYVDLANKADPVLRKRPTLDQKPDKTEVAILELIVIPAVPACSLDVTGPVNGVLDHPGGDLTLHFALPGQYVIRCEAFPYRYTEWTVVVHTTAAAANTDQATPGTLTV